MTASMGVRPSPSLSYLLDFHSAAASLSIRNPAREFTGSPPRFSISDLALLASMLARSTIPCACAAASALRLVSLHRSPRDLRRRTLRVQVCCVAAAAGAGSSQPESTALPIATQSLLPSSSLSNEPAASMIVQSSTSWLPSRSVVQSINSAALRLARALDVMSKILTAYYDRFQPSTRSHAAQSFSMDRRFPWQISSLENGENTSNRRDDPPLDRWSSVKCAEGRRS